jgi:short-subunit dehydrogenase
MADAFERKVAIITGASSGIGYATALAFAREGYNVILAARRKKALDQVAKECEQKEVRAIAVVANTTDEKDIQKIVDTAVQTFGHFNVWVNGAAVSLFGKFEEAPMEMYRRVIETNFFGYVYGARAALKRFKEQGHGTLINISSVTALVPQPYTSAYVSSKYAIRGLSESLRMELELEGNAKNIHVCTVMPASIDTRLFQNAANYTGRKVVALEPVYDPEYAAKQIVSLAKRPRREVVVGPAGKMMALEHAVLPGSEKMFAHMIDRNHLGHTPVDQTAGNLFEPFEEEASMRGGWRETRIRADRLNAGLGATILAVAAAFGAGMLAVERCKNKSIYHKLVNYFGI